MPTVSAKCKVQSAKLIKSTNHFKLKPGFTLIEILISLIMIMALVVILLASTGTLTVSRGSNLQGLATKIASRQMENLRNTDYTSLPANCKSSDPPCGLSDSDLAKLPSGTAKQVLDSYESSADIKQITIQVDWTSSGAPKQIKVESLIYKYGL